MNPTAVLEPVLASPPPVQDDDVLYEIIDGKRVELPPMSAYAVRVSFRIASLIGQFAAMNNLGEAAHEEIFRLPLDRDRNRRPDAAFVSYHRWPKDRPMPIAGNAWEVAPDLAVEVVSPTDLIDELREKVVEYYQAGVRLVWVVYPRLQLVDVYESATHVRVLARTDELDGGAVLPGFRTPVVALFPEAAPPA
jgi:Uma2 family endonuclease